MAFGELFNIYVLLTENSCKQWSANVFSNVLQVFHIGVVYFVFVIGRNYDLTLKRMNFSGL